MDLISELTPDTIVLTPNQRLSSVLQKQYQAQQLADGHTCWTTPTILEISTWFQKTWRQFTARQLTAHPLVLSPSQEHILWEEILRETSENALLQLSHSAELARSAWNVLKQWRVDIHHPGLPATEDSQIFQQWALQFQQRCKQQNWLDIQSVPDRVTAAIAAGEWPAPARLICTGFAEMTPQQQFFLETCRQAGSDIVDTHTVTHENPACRLSLPDTTAERYAMARWAKALHDRTTTDTIGCVIPNLEDAREQIIQIFSDVFSPPATCTLDHTTLPFNISAGKRLSEYPVIHSALRLLGIHKQKIPLETLSHLLHSPFLGGAEREAMARAKLDAALRRDNLATLSLPELAQQKATQQCKDLAKRLQQYLAVIIPANVKLPASEWVLRFHQQLTLWGWPGERTLDSAEYQTVKAWLKVLAEYSTYDPMLNAMTASTALHYLTFLTAKKIFQPESPAARVQILGPLEAAALSFDHLWVMGLDDATWPQAPKPNPFIPQRLQKQLHMPRATAERELLYAKHITAQFRANARHVIFSHAEQEDDAELRVSPLLADLPTLARDALPQSDFIAPTQILFDSRDVETLRDDLAPVISETEAIHGGTRIFKNQALCPFKAFAELRLHARKMEPTTAGLRATERGDIVHGALERFWQEVQSLNQLLAMSHNELQDRIAACVEQAIHAVATPTASNKRYLALEALRLQKLLNAWLDVEKARPDFAIEAIELEQETTFAAIPLRVRVDRIDRLANGKRLMIDYKTGKSDDNKVWFGDRPDEPQLPLYCLLEETPPAGILFAKIHPEKMGWNGISEMPLGLRGVDTVTDSKNTACTNWADLLAHWKIVLEKLGQDFRQGIASVDPKDPDDTCKHCHLQTLCRINETITEP